MRASANRSRSQLRIPPQSEGRIAQSGRLTKHHCNIGRLGAALVRPFYSREKDHLFALMLSDATDPLYVSADPEIGDEFGGFLPFGKSSNYLAS